MGNEFIFWAVIAAILLLLQRLYWSSKCRHFKVQLGTSQSRIDSLKNEVAFKRRDDQALLAYEKELHFITRALGELPLLASQLHSQVEPRLVPILLQKIVTRLFDPAQTIIFLRRRKAETAPGRDDRLVLAAVARPSDDVKPGMEVDINEGRLGLVAQTQRLMSREDFEDDSAATKEPFNRPTLGGLEFDLISPMVFDDATVGLIALSGPKYQSEAAKGLLRLASQIGAVAVRNVLAYSRMKHSADIDGLTRLYNKQYMTVTLGDLTYQANQMSSPLSAFLFDIDHFKNYNDTNGHDAGDKLLQLLARLVEDNIRRNSIFGRVGGEEFLVIFPDTEKEQALKAAELIRSKIEGFGFPFAERQPLGIMSVSGGVASCPEDALDSAELFRQADRALYRAKKSGRNLILSAEPHHFEQEDHEVVELK